MKKLTAAEIAEIAHENFVVLSMMNEDYSAQSWNDLSESSRESAVKHAQFLLDNPNSTPQAAHDAWFAERKANGWKWGEKLDIENKLDPGIVEYSQRSKRHHAKAYLFRRIVETLSKFI